MSSKSGGFTPSRMIVVSILITAIIGTTLLNLPLCKTRFIPLIDVIFTGISSICVTGLMTVPLDSYTHFGHIVIMILIQIGGLGIITLTLFTVSLFTNLALATQVMAGQMLDLESWNGTKKILLFIIAVTLFCELFGAFILFQSLKHHYSFGIACFYALFQSISAFCNAGIDIIQPGISLYTKDMTMLSTMSGLIIIGSIGFITLKELINKYIIYPNQNKKYLSLQTRIVLSYFSLLIFLNTIVFWLLERNNTLRNFNLKEQIINAFFLSVNSRSCGFSTIPIKKLQLASLFNIMINSFIGSAPGSTGSGIKLTTAALFVATINAAIQGHNNVNIQGRKIMQDQINKALAVVALSALWVTLITFCLLITEHNWHFLDIVFEALGAFTTLGISIGITPYLSSVGKVLIIITMFIGRVGSLTLLIALRKRNEKKEFSFPPERVMIS